MNNKFQKGNTVRFSSVFYDFADQVVDPDTVTMSILNAKFASIATHAPQRDDAGKYHADVTLSQAGEFYAEWTGMIQALPSVRRDYFIVEEYSKEAP